MSGLVFSVDGFALQGVDSDGVKWTTEKVAGWHGAPPMRTARSSRSQQSGTEPATGHSDERLVTLSGKARGVDTPTIEAAGRRLAAVLASGGMGSLVGESDYGVLSTSVAIEDAPEFELIAPHMAVWQLTVAAPDPLLYGPPTYGSASLASATPGAGRVWPREWPTDWGVAPGVTPGAVLVANAGTAAYWPRLRIDGPVWNPVVTMVETGAWVRINGTIPAGQYVDLLMAERRVLLHGTISIRHWPVTSSGDWLAVPPGGGSITWTDDGGSPAALLSVWGSEGAWS